MTFLEECQNKYSEKFQCPIDSITAKFIMERVREKIRNMKDGKDYSGYRFKYDQLTLEDILKSIS